MYKVSFGDDSLGTADNFAKACALVWDYADSIGLEFWQEIAFFNYVKLVFYRANNVNEPTEYHNFLITISCQ